MRAAIAKTVSTSWSNIPHYMVTIAIDMQKADALSRKIKESGTKVSINDMIIKASAAALQESSTHERFICRQKHHHAS